jgi:arginyl-tRNA synthetase
MEYAIDTVKKQLTGLFEGITKEPVDIETPPENIDADFAVPLFNLSKKLHKNPEVLALEFQDKIKLDKTLFSRVERHGAYLNFYLDGSRYGQLVLEDYKKLKKNYGSSSIGKNKTVIIDYSSPNIAKPFSIGHLRSTVIGQSLYNIYNFLGCKVIGDNHLGDWGTQFGKLICAYEKWGNEKKLDKEPIRELLNLYVRFHAEAKNNKKLEDEARDWFRKLEEHDKTAVEIWKKFSAQSTLEFNKIYGKLKIKFDYQLGESFYVDKTDEIIKECLAKKIAKWIPAIDDGKMSKDEKVLAIDMSKYGFKIPFLLQKSDGTTLYATRDLAAIKYRIKKWNPNSILYVVGSEQKLYFSQLFKAAELLGYKADLAHIDFGLIRLPDGKMSTREGKVIFLDNVLLESVNRVNKIIHVREMNKRESEQVAEIVGYGAIKYADLSQNRIHDVPFDWEKIISLKGNSGPYLQYQCVRIKSILKKAGKIDLSAVDFSLLTHGLEQELINKISKFNSAVADAARLKEPHLIATYLYELAQSFSKFYEKLSIINAKLDLKKSRLVLAKMTARVLENGLDLLGIEVPEKM